MVGAVYFRSEWLAKVEAWLGRSLPRTLQAPTNPEYYGVTPNDVIEYNGVRWSTLGPEDANGCRVLNGNNDTMDFRFGNGTPPDEIKNFYTNGVIEVYVYDLGRVR
jgi:hypothetical protein